MSLYEYDYNKPAFAICLWGGLGNQLFMLFAGLSKAIDEKRDFICLYTNENARVYYFNNILKLIADKNKCHECNFWGLRNLQGDYNNDGGLYNEIPNDYLGIRGYFQHFLYSFHNRDKIIECLGFNDYLNSHKFPFKTIGLHFRFGDFLSPGLLKCVSRPSYYSKAIKMVQELLKEKGDETDYKYVIFSTQNDNELVNSYITEINENLSTNIEFIKSYEYLKEDSNDYDDFFYISNCDHFILPQYSTFSLFANYLTYEKENKNKIVTYPDLWDGYGNAPTTRMFFDEWIRIYE